MLISIFFLVVGGLSAQIPNETRFFVLPITGVGTAEAKSFLYDRINYEVAFQNYGLVWSRRGSDYILRGTIHPVFDVEDETAPQPPNDRQARTTGDRREFLSWEVRDTALFYDTSSNRYSQDYQPEFVLVVRLMRTRTNELLSEKQLVFNDLDDKTKHGISQMMTDFFMQVPDPEPYSPDVGVIPTYIALTPEPEEPEETPAQRRRRLREERRQDDFDDQTERFGFSNDWRDKLFFFKYGFIWAPRENIVDNTMNYLNLGMNLALEVQFLPFLALEAGAQVIQETSGGDENRDLLLEFPLAMKIVLKPGKNLMLGLFGGLSFNYISLMDAVTPSKFSYFGGLELCFNTKSGIFVIEPRYTIDIDASNLGPDLDHKRKMWHVGVGYKTGLLSKLVRKRD